MRPSICLTSSAVYKNESTVVWDLSLFDTSEQVARNQYRISDTVITYLTGSNRRTKMALFAPQASLCTFYVE